MKHFYLSLQKIVTDMARCILNKGIQFTVKVAFNNGFDMLGVLRNHIDKTKFISVNSVIVKDYMLFIFPPEETLKLLSGSCAFEVYNNKKELMIFCDNFAFARENIVSLN